MVVTNWNENEKNWRCVFHCSCWNHRTCVCVLACFNILSRVQHCIVQEDYTQPCPKIKKNYGVLFATRKNISSSSFRGVTFCQMTGKTCIASSINPFRTTEQAFNQHYQLTRLNKRFKIWRILKDIHPLGKSPKIGSKMCSVLVVPSTWDRYHSDFQGTFKIPYYWKKTMGTHRSSSKLTRNNLNPWGFSVQILQKSMKLDYPVPMSQDTVWSFPFHWGRRRPSRHHPLAFHLWTPLLLLELDGEVV